MEGMSQRLLLKKQEQTESHHLHRQMQMGSYLVHLSHQKKFLILLLRIWKVVQMENPAVDIRICQGNHLSVSKTDTLKIQELVRETHKTTRC